MESCDAKRIEVVAGLIFRRGKLLVCQRNESGPFPMKWEFPGGKVEIGEICADALRRELKEELGIQVGKISEVLRYQHAYPGTFAVDLRFFRIDDFRGEVQNLVFQRLAWVAVDELPTLDFLEGDLPLTQFLSSSDASRLWV
ncbi:MAG: (deoxy)nucleoside triphosphate pyrophosphohydrolase [Candidatus Binatia bacterium]